MGLGRVFSFELRVQGPVFEWLSAQGFWGYSVGFRV